MHRTNWGKMDLATRVSCALLAGIVTIAAVTQLYRSYEGNRRLADFSKRSAEALEQEQWKSVLRTFQATEHVVRSTIEQGDMSKLDSLLRTFGGIEGVEEYTLFDKQGKASFSSDRAHLKDRLPEELKNRLVATRGSIQRLDNNAFQIYQPVISSAKCLECHDDQKNGELAGVTHFVLSADALTKARAQWDKALADLKAAELKQGIVGVAAMVGGLAVLVWWQIRRMVAKPLRHVIGSLAGVSAEVQSAAGQLSGASQSLAEGASEQAASLEETSASLEELSSMTRRNAENATKAADLGKQARHAAEKGAAGIQAMSAAMGKIKTSSDNIAKIIKTIDEIAFQTNILALNAAVEAARAGEAGAGFAVVADEVRNLAQRCAAAAKETAEKIEDSMKRSEQGAQISAAVTRSFSEIQNEVRQLDQLVGEIAAASQEQSQGISQVNMAVSQMDKVTQSNAANAEETASAAEELNAQAETLKEAVTELHKLVGGENPALTHAEHPRRNGLAATPKARARAKSTAQPAPVSLPASRTKEIPLEGDFKDF